MILWKFSSLIVADWSSSCFFSFLWCCLMYFSFFMNFSSFRFLIFHFFFSFVLSGCETHVKFWNLSVMGIDKDKSSWELKKTSPFIKIKKKGQVFMFTFLPSKWSWSSRGLHMMYFLYYNKLVIKNIYYNKLYIYCTLVK